MDGFGRDQLLQVLQAQPDLVRLGPRLQQVRSLHQLLGVQVLHFLQVQVQAGEEKIQRIPLFAEQEVGEKGGP